MSCKHGNWEPCEECEVEDAIYKSGFADGVESITKEFREKGTVVEALLQQELDSTRAIEAEVLQAQEPVVWFSFADSNGPVPLELWGFDQKACKHAVLENARSVGWKGTIEGYLLHMGWTIRPIGFLNPQPPAPCPKCAESRQDAAMLKASLQVRGDHLKQCEQALSDRDEQIDALQAKVAELTREVAQWKNNHATVVRQARVLEERTDMPLERVKAYEHYGEMIERVAELRVEIEEGAQIMEQHCTKVRAQGATIAQQAERIAELEKERNEMIGTFDSQIKALQTLNGIDEFRDSLKEEYRAMMRDAMSTANTQAQRYITTIAAQAALIEKCEKALLSAQSFIGNGVELGFIRMPDKGVPDPAHQTPGKIDEALAAIVAHKS